MELRCWPGTGRGDIRDHDEMMTDRLRLVPLTQQHRLAFQQSREAFASLLGVTLPKGWPEFPEAFGPGFPEAPAPWSPYLFLHRTEPKLIGNGGYVGAPDADGVVEIGYEVGSEHQNTGYATEAAGAMVAGAFEAGANAVIAHSLAEANASNTVMRKLGMRFDGDVEQQGLKIWRWRINR
jgi:RimJ/RimL family protein N-acetyltransferase